MDEYGLSKEQHEHIVETFKWFDKNGDGFICTDELGLALRLAGFNPSNDEIEKTIASVAGNSEKRLDLDGFMKMMAEKCLKVNEKQQLRDAFKVFDKNGDGRICANELCEALEKVGETLSKDEAKELMKKGDIDKNGTICYEEFVVLMTDLHPEDKK